mmetsp:Transcript_41026/g.62080  ORF Transcript_41026/g.62080 Transcript_41026/m.62080 type:complete len:259 (+) Transcript_41026:360-1136(+)
MGKHYQVKQWLQDECSGEREESLKILGFDGAGVFVADKDIRKRYLELAKAYHPDRIGSMETEKVVEEDRFNRIRDAFEHLTGENQGRGSQENPKHKHLRMLTTSATIAGRKASMAAFTNINDSEKDAQTFSNDDQKEISKDNEDDIFFQKRILAVISDFGKKGCPVSVLPKRWNQIWPDKPFPSHKEYIVDRFVQVGSRAPSSTSTEKGEKNSNITCLKKRVKLLPFLKWKCRGFVRFRKVNGTILMFDNNDLDTSIQ